MTFKKLSEGFASNYRTGVRPKNYSNKLPQYPNTLFSLKMTKLTVPGKENVTNYN